MRGKLITVEGLDGAGKTTHLAHVRGILERCGAEVVATREPGGTPLGEALREIVLDPAQRLAPGTEALLMFAARHEHLRRVIEPALAAGKWVLCDRYTDASFAYQAGGSGVVWEKIEVLERWVQADSQPDLTLYFDVEPAIAKQRMRAIKGPDRFEQEEGAFQERVRAAYLRRAREHRARFRIIDANRSPAEVQKELEEVLVIYCSSVGKQSGARS